MPDLIIGPYAYCSICGDYVDDDNVLVAFVRSGTELTLAHKHCAEERADE